MILSVRLPDDCGFYVPCPSEGEQFFGEVSVCHGEMVFPAVVENFVAEGVAAGIELDFQRIAADEQVGIDALR